MTGTVQNVAAVSQDSSITGVLRDHAELFADQTFLVDASGEELTYAQAYDLSRRIAGGLAQLGVTAGDRVAIFMQNSARQAAAAFAVNMLGAVWSPISTDYRGEWLGTTLTDIGANVLFTDAVLLPKITELPDIATKTIVVSGAVEVPAPVGVTFVEFDSLPGHEPIAEIVESSAGDTTAILWTSGTTGKSKGVIQSNASWLQWARYHNEAVRGGVRPGERFYGCTPMYNSGGWIMSVFPALVSGATACIDDRFSVSEFWDRLRKFGGNHVMLLGTMHMYLWQAPEQPTDADNPLRTMLMNPVIPQLVKPFLARFGIERIWSGYGQSEVMGATLYHTDMPDLKPGSCGYVGQGMVDTAVLDDQDRPVAVGETGEICVRPREPFSIYSGYFGEPELTNDAWRNLWHHTGDLGRIDEDGELFFVDRKKDSLRHKGRNISTFEVEHIVRQHPQVAQVAAIGVRVADFEHEEELKICIVAKPGEPFDPLEFCQFIDAKAPYFFVPRYVEVLDQLPMTPTNKVQKYVLRDRGNGPATWDRETAAPDWKPTRNH